MRRPWRRGLLRLVVPSQAYFQCQAEGPAPGDCGEGFHFIHVAYSRISGNHVADNSGGVLLSDDLGPTHNNLVNDNVVTNNASDCGITVPPPRTGESWRAGPCGTKAAHDHEAASKRSWASAALCGVEHPRRGGRVLPRRRCAPGVPPGIPAMSGNLPNTGPTARSSPITATTTSKRYTKRWRWEATARS